MTQASAQKAVEEAATLAHLSQAEMQELRGLLIKGQKYFNAQDYPNAAKYLVAAWNMNPYDFNLLITVADVLARLGVRTKAMELLEKALAIHGAKPEVVAILGNLAMELDMGEIMEKLFRIYITLAPEDPMGYNNLASALGRQDKHDEAIAFLQETIPLFPENAALWNTVGSSVAARDGYKASIPFYAEAYRLDPKSYNILNNISLAYEHCGQHKEAADFARKAIKLDPKNWNAHMGLATALLCLGDLKNGFREYEWRQAPRATFSLLYTHGLPRWDGRSLKGKKLLIGSEQGLGDEILFALAYHDLAKDADQLYIGCDRRLVSLYQRSFPTARIGAHTDQIRDSYRYRIMPDLQKNDEDCPPADVFIECGSIPHYRWKSAADLPKHPKGHLTPDPDRVAFWQDRLAALGDRPKIGMFWRSGLQNSARNKHYAPIEVWEPIFKAFPDVDFINLQYGDSSAERAQVLERYGVTIHHWDDLDLKDDLEGVAALSAAVELAIGPATAPAAFCYAVGTPVWFLLPARPWWSFGSDDEAPAFHGCRMFLGPIDDPWQDITPRVIAALRNYLNQRPNSGK